MLNTFIHSFIHFRYLYSAPSRFLLRGAPDYSADTESEFHAEAHEQLRVKDLPRVPTRRLEVDSNPQPSGCKAPNIPLLTRIRTRNPPAARHRTYLYTTAPHDKCMICNALQKSVSSSARLTVPICFNGSDCV